MPPPSDRVVVNLSRMSFKMNNNTTEQMPRSIVGLVWDPTPRAWWVPPGLEQTQGPNAKPKHYLPVSFGADREYGPEEGWQVFTTRKQRQTARRRNRQRGHAYYSEPVEDESYDFTDE
jgi:hypothetical protein